MVAGLGLSELADVRALFCRQLLNSLTYWQRQVASPTQVLTALDHEMTNLARTIEFGLQSHETRREALRLLARAHDIIVRRGSSAFGNDLLALMVRETRLASPAHEALDVLDLAAQLYDRRGLSAEAEHCYRESLALVGDHAVLRGRVQAELGRFLVERERTAEGLPMLEAALATAEAHSDRLTQAYALLALGWHYHYLVSDGQAAERHLLRALPLLEALNETNLLARVWLDLANAHWRLGDYDRAEEDCTRAQAYLPQAGNLRLQAMIEAMRGALICDRGCFAESLDYLARAERLYQSLGEGREMANVYLNMGVAYWGLEQWELSAEYSRRALHLWQALKQLGREAEAYCNLAWAYLPMGAIAETHVAMAKARALVAQQQQSLGDTPWAQSMLARIADLDDRLQQCEIPDAQAGPR
jgi:tetratricopeptide (TPR) repeat protein